MGITYLMSCSVGCVCCDPKEPIKVCTRFRARILLFNIEVPVTQGFPVSGHKHTQHTFPVVFVVLQWFYSSFLPQVLLHYQTVSEPATIRKLISVLHKSSGEVLKKKPK